MHFTQNPPLEKILGLHYSHFQTLSPCFYAPFPSPHHQKKSLLMRVEKVGLEQCDSCGFERPAYNSCRNRHCPKCQSLAKLKWLDKQKSELLPVGYFHLVFTLPHDLNALILTNKKILLSHLFKAVGETLIDFGRTRLGGQIGLITVLHTWDQTLLALCWV
jgi:hypothetical protein